MNVSFILTSMNDPSSVRVNIFIVVETHNIGIQINRKDLIVFIHVSVTRSARAALLLQ